jgi:hypothetical protein
LAQIIQGAMNRLEKRGSGISLRHDVHPATVAAQPGLLSEFNEHGFHVVQVVPPTPAAPWETGDGERAESMDARVGDTRTRHHRRRSNHAGQTRSRNVQL